MTSSPTTQTGASVRATDAVGEDAVRRILRERAQILARPPQEEEAGETVSLMVVAIGAERYGVNIRHVQEVKPLSELTSVPCTPQVWAGLVNLRGSLYPVLDLRRYLELAEDDSSDPKVALVSSSDTSIGLLIDDVSEVRRVPTAEIRPPLSGGSGTKHEVVRGVTPDLLSILDLEALISDPALVVKDEPS